MAGIVERSLYQAIREIRLASTSMDTRQDEDELGGRKDRPRERQPTFHALFRGT
jgi:hypothetical protein